MDTLSKLLDSVRIDAARFVETVFVAVPWSSRTGDERDRRDGASHPARLSFVAAGRCRVRLEGSGDAVELHAGDLVLLPRDDACAISSDPRAAGEATRLVSGQLACSPGMTRSLLEALPRLLRVPVGEGLPRQLLAAGVRESSAAQPGTDSTLVRLAELLLVDVLRRYAETLPPAGQGWLAGLRDARIAQALALMHGEPGRAWTIDELARRAALSRSALADRFAALVGEPPMQYLTRWRLALAARALRSGVEAVARVAERAGYESDAAFSRAFKRAYGMPPAAWRRAARPA